MENKNTQEKLVLEHLKTYGGITSWFAFEAYGITRLSAYIHNLRKDGYKITTEMCTGKNRFGNAVNFARYILETD